MFTTGSKLFFGASALALVSALVVAACTDGPLSSAGVLGLLSVMGILAFLGGVNYANRDCNVSGMDEAAAETAAAAHRAGRPSAWPAAAALGVAGLVIGAVSKPVVFKVAVVLVLAGVVEWMVLGWSERASDDDEFNANTRRRLLYPLEIPILAAVALGAIVELAFVRRFAKSSRLVLTVATIGMFVDLPPEFKGTHMSRFIEVLNAHGNIIHVENLTAILRAMQAKFQAETSRLEIEFPYFMVKQAPVTGMESVMDYQARFDAMARREEIRFLLTVKAGVTTLCPCSKAISDYGAHSQRGEVTVQIRSRKAVWIEDVIALIESSASAELYALLKRQDEKAVTEHAYTHPVFVEDLVRNVALKLNALPEVTWYKVEAENQESIHHHNAYACIEKH